MILSHSIHEHGMFYPLFKSLLVEFLNNLHKGLTYFSLIFFRYYIVFVASVNTYFLNIFFCAWFLLLYKNAINFCT